MKLIEKRVERADYNGVAGSGLWNQAGDAVVSPEDEHAGASTSRARVRGYSGCTQGAACQFAQSCSIKTRTLVDFDRTWGPAVQVVLRHLAGGDAGLYRKLSAESGLVDGARFRPNSPLIDEP